jgi:hypothetical protein
LISGAPAGATVSLARASTLIVRDVGPVDVGEPTISPRWHGDGVTRRWEDLDRRVADGVCMGPPDDELVALDVR